MSSGTFTKVTLMAAAAVLLSQPVFGQGGSKGGGGGAGTTGAGAGAGAGSTTPTPTPTRPTTQPQQQQQQSEPMPQPIFVSGRVLLEDGTAPTDQVVMERVCNGVSKSEGYTDTKGYFGFELGRRNNGMIHDASEDPANDPFNRTSGFGNSGSGNAGMASMIGGADARLMGCELRARLTGYRSQTVNLSMRRALDNPDVGVILLHRMGANEGGTVSAISAAASKDAKKAYEKGLDLIKKKKADEAAKNLEKAVELYPKYATAWYELGRLRMSKGDKEGARTAFDTAMKADPKYIMPYLDMAMIEVQAQKWEQVAELTAAAVKLDPFSYPLAHFYNAVANYNLKNVEAAEKSAIEVERLDTRHTFPQNFQLLGILMAQRQEYKGALDRLRNYMKFAPPSTDFTNVKNQIDQIDKLAQGASAAKQ